MSFYFLGRGPFSKSLLLRALIVQSYFPELQITGDSECDDVVFLKEGLKDLKNQTVMDCSHGGAVLRFLTLRASREIGSFTLKGSERLFQRPMRELQMILNQLACEIKFNKNNLILKAHGWHLSGDALTVSMSRSSQFVSSVLLNSWKLDRDLFISVEGNMVSSSYLQMTLSFLRSLGMRITGDNREYHIPANQRINHFIYKPEADMSCLFSLAALTATEGEVIFTDWPEQSFQPDFIFPSLLKKMGFQVKQVNQTLKINGAGDLHPIECNLKNCPDLFPVLAALCALAKGTSRLYGAPHLHYKESDRVEQMAKLLQYTGRTVTVLDDGLVIRGQPVSPGDKSKPIIGFDPKEDHRMAMAVAVLKKAGEPIQLLNPGVVNKSFPDFWSIVNVNP